MTNSESNTEDAKSWTNETLHKTRLLHSILCNKHHKTLNLTFHEWLNLTREELRSLAAIYIQKIFRSWLKKKEEKVMRQTQGELAKTILNSFKCVVKKTVDSSKAIILEYLISLANNRRNQILLKGLKSIERKLTKDIAEIFEVLKKYKRNPFTSALLIRLIRQHYVRDKRRVKR